MKSEAPKISIIIAVYNGAKTLQRCIDSMANQTYSNVELIIIDGASTDDTVDMIKANEEHVSYWESEPDRGIAHAWNKGVLKANGDWAFFLGADDYLYDENTLEIVSRELSQLPENVLLAYGTVNMVSEGGELIETVANDWESAKKRFMVENTIPHQGCFHHKNLFKEFGLFSEELIVVSDYEMILRYVSKHGEVYSFCNIIVANMQVGGISNDRVQRLSTYLEFQRARKMNGCNSFSVPFIALVLKGLLGVGMSKVFKQGKERI